MFILKHRSPLISQDYPASRMLTALRAHPAMTDNLFTQLFDSQCKVSSIKHVILISIFSQGGTPRSHNISFVILGNVHSFQNQKY